MFPLFYHFNSWMRKIISTCHHCTAPRCINITQHIRYRWDKNNEVKFIVFCYQLFLMKSYFSIKLSQSALAQDNDEQKLKVAKVRVAGIFFLCSLCSFEQIKTRYDLHNFRNTFYLSPWIMVDNKKICVTFAFIVYSVIDNLRQV